MGSAQERHGCGRWGVMRRGIGWFMVLTLLVGCGSRVPEVESGALLADDDLPAYLLTHCEGSTVVFAAYPVRGGDPIEVVRFEAPYERDQRSCEAASAGLRSRSLGRQFMFPVDDTVQVRLEDGSVVSLGKDIASFSWLDGDTVIVGAPWDPWPQEPGPDEGVIGRYPGRAQTIRSIDGTESLPVLTQDQDVDQVLGVLADGRIIGTQWGEAPWFVIAEPQSGGSERLLVGDDGDDSARPSPQIEPRPPS